MVALTGIPKTDIRQQLKSRDNWYQIRKRTTHTKYDQYKQVATEQNPKWEYNKLKIEIVCHAFKRAKIRFFSRRKIIEMICKSTLVFSCQASLPDLFRMKPGKFNFARIFYPTWECHVPILGGRIPNPFEKPSATLAQNCLIFVPTERTTNWVPNFKVKRTL